MRPVSQPVLVWHACPSPGACSLVTAFVLKSSVLTSPVVKSPMITLPVLKPVLTGLVEKSSVEGGADVGAVVWHENLVQPRAAMHALFRGADESQHVSMVQVNGGWVNAQELFRSTEGHVSAGG